MEVEVLSTHIDPIQSGGVFRILGSDAACRKGLSRRQRRQQLENLSNPSPDEQVLMHSWVSGPFASGK